MSTRPEVQAELRRLFRQGATPSRLIQHIASCHRGEAHFHGLVQLYFLETFGVPIVRNLDPHDDYADIGLKYASLNESVLHEMVQAGAGPDPSWLDGLTATGPEDRLRDAGLRPPAELSRAWDKLDDRERSAVVRLVAGFNGRSEQVRILARLAEQLQRRIDELEGNPSAPAAALAGKNGE